MHDCLLPFVLAASLARLAAKLSQSRSRSVEPVADSCCWWSGAVVRAEDADGQKSGKVSLPPAADGICPMRPHWPGFSKMGEQRESAPIKICILLKAAEPAERTPSLSHAAKDPCSNMSSRRISAARTDHLMMCWRMQVIVFGLGSLSLSESSTASASPPEIQQQRPSPIPHRQVLATPNSHLIAVTLIVSLESKLCC
jgi:hypothetical protein